MSNFMALLENQDMRPFVIDLLSLVSIDGKGEPGFFSLPRARIDRAIQSVRQFHSALPPPFLPQGTQSFLSAFLSCYIGSSVMVQIITPHPLNIILIKSKTGRFKDEATDYMMLVLASALASTAPVNDQYRHKILTGLWCCYGAKKLTESASKTLFQWFTLALFGRHATQHEVTAWSRGCELWLQGELGGTGQPAQPAQPTQTAQPSQPSQTALPFQLTQAAQTARTESPRPLTPEPT
jgi:hypothetical protein